MFYSGARPAPVLIGIAAQDIFPGHVADHLDGARFSKQRNVMSESNQIELVGVVPTSVPPIDKKVKFLILLRA